MLQSPKEETEGKLQMRLSPGKKGLDSLLKEVMVFKEGNKAAWASRKTSFQISRTFKFRVFFRQLC